MIRIYVKIIGTCPEGSITGCQYKSFDVEADKLEKFLKDCHGYESKSVVGAEVLE